MRTHRAPPHLQALALAQAVVIAELRLGVALLPGVPEVGQRRGLDVGAGADVEVLQLVLVLVPLLLCLACARAGGARMQVSPLLLVLAGHVTGTGLEDTPPSVPKGRAGQSQGGTNGPGRSRFSR